MPKFSGPVTLSGRITVEGDDMYDADAKAQKLTVDEVLELVKAQRGGLDVEVFADEFPDEVG